MPWSFSPDIKVEALALYAAGASCRAAAAVLRARGNGPSQESIHQWAAEAGILRTKSRADELMNSRLQERSIEEADMMRLRAREFALNRKWSSRYIAEVLGVSRNFVKHALGESVDSPSNATRKRHWEADHPDVDERRQALYTAIDMKDAGESIPAIACAVSRSESIVWLWLRDAGRTGSRDHPKRSKS